MNDSSRPEFWDQRYASQRMPWDFGGVPLALRRFLAHEPPASVLIPGCGTGYEAQTFSVAGWNVDAVDFSEEAVQCAHARLGKADAGLVRLGDFFEPNPRGPFDLIYERTFLCSLPPNLWPRYAAQVRHSLRSGGRLAGFFFLGPEPDPPPHALGEEGLARLLGDAFECLEDESVTDSLPLFEGKERWQVWRRK